MATPLTADQLRGGQKSLTLFGQTFAVGAQTTSFKKPTGTGPIQLNTPGLVFEGYDFRGRDLIVTADNVVIRNCLGNATGLYTIWQQKAAKGLLVERVTIDSRGGVEQTQNNENFVLSENGAVTVQNCVFLDTPVDCLNLPAGLIQNNVLIGAFYSPGAHADGVSIHRTTGPIQIVDNYIDFRLHKTGEGTNACVKVVSHFGAISDVVVDKNVLIGGGFNTYVGVDAHPISGVKLTNNLMGLTEYGDKPEQFIMGGNHGSGFVMTNNTLFSAAPNNVVSVGTGQQPPTEPPPGETDGKYITSAEQLEIKNALVTIARIIE